VREGTFRQDLYFRLNVVRLSLRPLRERREEILPLARQFVEDVAVCYEEPSKTLAVDAEVALLRYDWPGNVRDLRNAIERAFLYCRDRTIRASDLPAEVLAASADDSLRSLAATNRLSAIPRLADAERELIARALEATSGNQSDAARLLDVERHRLRRKIVLYGLEHLASARPR
jgi:two-component system, NtrC family, response regulator AtoC